MNNIDDLKELNICPKTMEMRLSDLEKYSAWQIISKEPNVFKMGKYFYYGMKAPSLMPARWYQVDCYLLGFLTERKCRLLSEESKNFIENFILDYRYKEYRRLLKNSQ
jgi:hypothetical protein